mmetsp:Transcript_17602/g.44852  ORF Transcript_17602/g.44852 Transcript_17602/m.44852 type:complete len:181 (-) Transcript_17602:141-683(-)
MASVHPILLFLAVALLLPAASLAAEEKDAPTFPSYRPLPQVGKPIAPLAANYCSICETVVGAVAKAGAAGCSSVCALIGLPPPLNKICEFIVATSCEKILDWIGEGSTSELICHKLSFCGIDCVCGGCTPDVFNDRCLSVPNHCPAPNTTITSGRTSTNTFCLDGVCSADTLGCCLTCFA